MKRRMVRLTILCAGLALFASGVAPLARRAFAADAKANVTLQAEGAQPREVEDTTEKAITRDYAAAWDALSAGLRNNDVNALDAGLVGRARDQFAQAIADQKQAGIKVRYTDKGHQLEAVFYSPDGSAMQLRDTAQLTREILDGDKVIQREDVTAHYYVLMSVAEDRWKLRAIQEVPNF
ncbi:MAG TPA: hypothetical protein VLA96_04855 [Terriglobales bacterium]|nr:hypothetical protein [Terriglobales bacterium]